ncbi:hypothetical protein [Ehrlichia ruminantium]|nr:hypothetical protein [Ehrlichia ruminantium]
MLDLAVIDIIIINYNWCFIKQYSHKHTYIKKLPVDNILSTC